MTGDGPTINRETITAYVRDELDDPVTQQFLDQRSAAADDVRAAFGIINDRTAEIPTTRALAALLEMWARVIACSEEDVCEHLADRPVQATVIDPHAGRQMCLDCAEEHRVRGPVLNERRECPGCGAVERVFFLGGHIQYERHQHGPYVAILLLCADCARAINEREMLPLDIRIGLAAIWREQDELARVRGKGGRR